MRTRASPRRPSSNISLLFAFTVTSLQRQGYVHKHTECHSGFTSMLWSSCTARTRPNFFLVFTDTSRHLMRLVQKVHPLRCRWRQSTRAISFRKHQYAWDLTCAGVGWRCHLYSPSNTVGLGYWRCFGAFFGYARPGGALKHGSKGPGGK